MWMQELDPPPWLNRMREMGYPPGYLGDYYFTMNMGIKFATYSECISLAFGFSL